MTKSSSFNNYIQIVMNINKEQTILEDFLAALEKPLQALQTLLKIEMKGVEETFDYRHRTSMEIIEEEQTDRQNQDDQGRMTSIRRAFNNHLRAIVKSRSKTEEILNVYKTQLKSMATNIMKMEEEFKKKDNLHASRKSSKAKVQPQYNLSENQKEEQLRARRPPQPTRTLVCPNCEKMEQNRTKWQSLSKKIDQFKKKSNAFEIQLKQKENELQAKDDQISSLKIKLTQSERQKQAQGQQELKKLKKDNTTLRGEKVLLTTQVSSLKKQLSEKNQLCDAQDLEVKKLRLQVDNINSSLTWHQNNLNQLRNSHRKSISQDQREQVDRNEALAKANRLLVEALSRQEEILTSFDAKTQRLQQAFEREQEKQEKRVLQLQNILEEKNETILRLKTGGKSQKNSTYHADLIKVLNKKLAQKEDLIRALQVKSSFEQ